MVGKIIQTAHSDLKLERKFLKGPRRFLIRKRIQARNRVLKTGPVQNTCPGQNMGPDQKKSPDQKTGPDQNKLRVQTSSRGYRCHIHIPIMFQMHRPQRTVSGGGVPYRGRNRMSPQTSSDQESGKQRLKTHQELEILKTLELQELLGSLGHWLHLCDLGKK